MVKLAGSRGDRRQGLEVRKEDAMNPIAGWCRLAPAEGSLKGREGREGSRGAGGHQASQSSTLGPAP